MSRSFAALFAALMCFAGVASAQDYPNKPIVMVVPFAAGGPTDVVGRNLAQAMSKNLKQSIVVENTVGAGGTIAGTKVARATPDGYTILLMHIGMSTAPALYRNLQFNPITDLEPIGLVVDTPMTLIARRNFPPNNLQELIAYLKKNKDKITLANAGLGAASHLCGLLFQSAIQTELTTVPYKGTAPAMNDILGGQVDVLCDQTTNTTAQIKAEKVKVYGVTTAKRLASLPKVPTLDEGGLKGFQIGVWHGIYAPKGTPKPIVDRLAAALQDAMNDANFRQKMAELGAEVYPAERGRPEALRTHLKQEIDRWNPIIKKAGVYAD